MKKITETSPATSFRPQTTSNGYKIYYDKASGEAVGIVYKNLVFLKVVSEREMNWYEAEAYCYLIDINDITAELCPVNYNSWREEFLDISKSLYVALKEIGAKNLDAYTWCAQRNSNEGCLQNFAIGDVCSYLKGCTLAYLRPVLVLDCFL